MNLRKKKSVLQSNESQEISSSHNSYLNKKKSREEKKCTKNKYKDIYLNKNDENSRIEFDDHKHILRNTETNFPGKYRKMNSGKYLYKTSKKSPVPREKTLSYFDGNIVKSMSIFFEKLGELEYEKLSKKKRNMDNIKFFSDENFNAKLLNKSLKDSCLSQGTVIDTKQQIDKNEYPIMVNNSNIYYNFGLNIFPNSSIFNDLNKQNYNQMNPLFFKNYDSSQLSNQNSNPINNKPGNKINTIYNEIDKKLFPTYNTNLFKTTKDYIRKNTLNHISAAKYIKSIQDQLHLNENLKSEGDNQTIKKECKKEIVSKTSTESEKSEEKLSVTNNNEHIPSVSSSNISKPFKYNVENMTKNQLNQIKEIVKGSR